MTTVKKLGNWWFKISQCEAIKAEDYGDVYSARISISVVNNQVHVYGLMSSEKDEFNLQDFRDLATYIKNVLGYDHYYRVRYKNGKELLQKVKI